MYVLSPGDIVEVHQERDGERSDFYYVCICHNHDWFFIATPEAPPLGEAVQVTRYEEDRLPSELHIQINVVYNSSGIEFKEAMKRRNPVATLGEHTRSRLIEAVKSSKTLRASVKEIICDRLSAGSDVLPYECEAEDDVD